MAEKNNYYGSGVFVAGNIDIGAIGKPADSRVMVPNLDGLAELVASERVYDGNHWLTHLLLFHSVGHPEGSCSSHSASVHRKNTS